MATHKRQDTISTEERIRQYAEVVLNVSRNDDLVSLTSSAAGRTVSAGLEVEPQEHTTTEYDQ